MIHLLAAATAWGLGRFLAGRFPKSTKRRGVTGDAKEALLKAGISAVPSIAASVMIQRVL